MKHIEQGTQISVHDIKIKSLKSRRSSISVASSFLAELYADGEMPFSMLRRWGLSSIGTVFRVSSRRLTDTGCDISVGEGLKNLSVNSRTSLFRMDITPSALFFLQVHLHFVHYEDYLWGGYLVPGQENCCPVEWQQDICCSLHHVPLCGAKLDLNFLILTEVWNDGVLQSQNSPEHEIWGIPPRWYRFHEWERFW